MISSGSCGEKPEPEQLKNVCEEPTEFEHINDFPFSCEDHLRVISYIERVHPRGENIEVLSTLQKAIRKVIGKSKLPTPYFSEDEDKQAPIKYKIHYVRFSPFTDEGKKEIEIVLKDFDQKSKLCDTIKTLSEKVSKRVLSSDEIVVPYISSMLHKGVLRYFVAGLDPHSYLIENLEEQYLGDEKLHMFVQRDKDDNAIKVSHSPKNPYFLDQKEVKMKGKWLLRKNSLLKIEIFNFSEDTADEFKKIYLEYYKQKKITGLIIDLRRNRGGEAYGVATLLDLFIKNGILLYFREKTFSGWQTEVRYASAGNELPGLEGLPVTILMSRYSASSSETFSVAMQDHKKALIIGEHSFGKGTGQRNAHLRDLPIPGGVCSSAFLVLTRLYTYSPKGKPLQLRGVIPDVNVEDREYLSLLGPIDFSDYFNTRERVFAHKLEIPEDIDTHFTPTDFPWIDRFDEFKSQTQNYFKSIDHLFTLNSLAEALP